jgi:ribonucleoside-diphosphate reductase beta chain
VALRQAWDLAFDPATGRRLCPEEVETGHILPSSRWPSFFSHIVARLQWDANAIDLAPDARAWAELADERRDRLTTLLAGFRVAEDAVAEHLTRSAKRPTTPQWPGSSTSSAATSSATR